MLYVYFTIHLSVVVIGSANTRVKLKYVLVLISAESLKLLIT
jgi:hypothetical protein